jgi:predicted N-acetyltransferase YhbS
VAHTRLRGERPDDRPAIADVTAAAFGSEREARMIDAIRSSDGFVPELSLVAEVDGRVVGHAMLSYVVLEGADRHVLELGPMSVKPGRQRAGIGSALSAKRYAARRRETSRSTACSGTRRTTRASASARRPSSTSTRPTRASRPRRSWRSRSAHTTPS